MKMTAVFKADLSGLTALEKAVPANVNTSTKKLAELLVDEIRQNWSSVSPSSPGEAPAVVTGTLDASILSEATGRDLMGRFSNKESAIQVVRIGAPHASFLEHGTSKMAARPFVLPAVLRVADQTKDAYRNVFSFKVNTASFRGDDE